MKGSHVENGNLGPMLRKLGWRRVLEALAYRRWSKSWNGGGGVSSESQRAVGMEAV